MIEKTFTITDKLGLHARPAGSLVKTANQFSSETFLVYKQKQVSLKSIIGIMTLGIKPGETVKITAAGEDEMDVLESITTVIDIEGIGVEYQSGEKMTC
ncbi:HPr family phosphocarrier protein [Robertmurraya korlensis]|uniref:HPr family phosphocarrier protein n=1 Tax=Robertmurraya korlensis TaxID=519977 RepID=UPI000826A75A|nr:HPr family phosphocarrier protein [Robertmurraya korlensis]